MNLNEIVSSLLSLPRRFNDLGNISVNTLLMESGYMDFPEQITEETILQGLRNHPECMRDWRGYSEDKRTTGWYLTEPNIHSYGLGYIASDGEDDVEPLIYADEASACAAFIKREIENIRTILSRSDSPRKLKSND